MELGFTEYIAERTRDFTGRQYVFEAVHEWLSQPSGPRFFLLTGRPGSGKTAIASRLCQFSMEADSPHFQPHAPFSSGYLSAHHFCSSGKGSWVDPRSFVRSLASQLARRRQEFAEALVNAGDKVINISAKVDVTTAHERSVVAALVIENLSLAGLNSQEAFNRAIAEPLQAVYQRGLDQPITILVDSLDEAQISYPDLFHTQQDGLLKALALRLVELGNTRRALEVVKSISSFGRDSAMSALIERLAHSPGASLLDELFDLVRQDTHSFMRDYLLADLILFLAEGGDSERALQEASSLPHHHRIKAMLGIAAHLEAGARSALWTEAMSAIDNTTEDRNIVIRGLVEVAARLPQPLKDQAGQKARSMIIADKPNVITFYVMIDLLDLLPAEDQFGVCQKALEIVLNEGLDLYGWEKLLPRLDKSQLDAALAKIKRITDDYKQAQALTYILPQYARLGKSAEALQAAINIARRDWRGKALAGLAPYLSEAQIDKALGEAEVSDDEGTLADALTGLAEWLPEDLLRRTFKSAQKVQREEFQRAALLTSLAARLAKVPPPERYRVWTDLIRDLANGTRVRLLKDLHSLIPLIAGLGGVEALLATGEAIEDVGRYWP